jgi:DNA-binding NarL/FixJ family response regulator
MAAKLLHPAVGKREEQLSRSPLDTLSDRELEVFRWIGHGLKTQEIAIQLHLSVKTIETYRDRIRGKFDLSDGTELACYAVQWVLENG